MTTSAWTPEQAKRALARIASAPLPSEAAFGYVRFMFDLRIALDYAKANPVKRSVGQEDPVVDARAVVFDVRFQAARGARDALTLGSDTTTEKVQHAKVAFARLRETMLELLP